jgi:hypothetical protein
MNPRPNHGHLGRKQRAVINDLLNGVNKYESLEKNKIRPFRYREWLKNELFRRELIGRIDAQKRQGKFLMLHCFPDAASKLAELLASDKPEIARKACVDVITLQKTHVSQDSEQKSEPDAQTLKISDDKAARMMAILAEKEQEPQSLNAQNTN